MLYYFLQHCWSPKYCCVVAQAYNQTIIEKVRCFSDGLKAEATVKASNLQAAWSPGGG